MILPDARVEELARQFATHHDPSPEWGPSALVMLMLQRHIEQAIRTAIREAAEECAKLCDAVDAQSRPETYEAAECAAAIRARVEG